MYELILTYCQIIYAVTTLSLMACDHVSVVISQAALKVPILQKVSGLLKFTLFEQTGFSTIVTA